MKYKYRDAGKEALEDLVRHLVPLLPLEEGAQLHNKGMPRQGEHEPQASLIGRSGDRTVGLQPRRGGHRPASRASRRRRRGRGGPPTRGCRGRNGLWLGQTIAELKSGVTNPLEHTDFILNVGAADLRWPTVCVIGKRLGFRQLRHDPI